MNSDDNWAARIAVAQRVGDLGLVELLYREWSMAEPKGAGWLLGLGALRLSQRRFVEAMAHTRQASERTPSSMRAWMQLAICARALNEPEQELAALRAALALDPYDLLALLAKGDCLDRLQRPKEALQAHRAAVSLSQQMDTEPLGAEVQRMIRRARAVVDRHSTELASMVDQFVAEQVANRGSEELDRFVHAVEIMLGRRQRFDAQPMGFFYPQLAPIEFFPTNRFPWAERVQDSTDLIRTELEEMLAQDLGFEPYIQYENDQPLAQWADLNQSTDWSAFHLIKDGVRVAGNADRCPQTMAILDAVPQPHQPQRTPVALFSCLKPKTRIPPHMGVSNVRLLVHLPLVVPEGCGFRVGSQTRQWRVGEILVFDDTIEHEAWNNSDALRSVLIFDIWHPDLSERERELVAGLLTVQDKIVRWT
jgi:aspartate beta-hydroxylase